MVYYRLDHSRVGGGAVAAARSAYAPLSRNRLLRHLPQQHHDNYKNKKRMIVLLCWMVYRYGGGFFGKNNNSNVCNNGYSKWWISFWKRYFPSTCTWIQTIYRQKLQQNQYWKTLCQFLLHPQQQQQRLVLPRFFFLGTTRDKEDEYQTTTGVVTKDILMYWFGQYRPEMSQKKLWMIPNSDEKAEYRQQVDADIYHRFASHLNPTSTYCTYHSTNNNNNNSNNISNSTWQDKVAGIVLYDQMSRHIHRHLSSSIHSDHVVGGNNRLVLLSQEGCDGLARELAEQFVVQHKQEYSCGMIPLAMYVFALFPYRHNHATLHDLQTILHDTHLPLLESLHQQDTTNLLSRFRKATQRRMYNLQYQQRRIGTTNNTNNNNKISTTFTEDDILETCYFEADMTNAIHHTVTQTIMSFLDSHVLPKHDTDDDGDDELLPVTVVVSLSGGVDSMVIASVLSYLVQTQPQKYNLKLIAVHIDYGNRPESYAEATFVQTYATDYLKFHSHLVQHMANNNNNTNNNNNNNDNKEVLLRGEISRDDYETKTRQIRYDLYQQALLDHNNNNNNNNNRSGVMLGHHRGDIRENVLSNAHRGCGPLDLSGMTSVSIVNGVTIFRPLLPLEKSYILDYAHLYGVPYFKDTTPQWSTRGKLRNHLLPLLEEIYGDGSMNNLTKLATDSDEARTLFQQTILQPFRQGITIYPMGLSFATTTQNTQQQQQQGLYFWKYVLREMLHSIGLGMWTDKSVTSFHQRLFGTTTTTTPTLHNNNNNNKKRRNHNHNPNHTNNNNNNNNGTTFQSKKEKQRRPRPPSKRKLGWLQCRKDYGVYANEENGLVYVLHPSSFPWRKSDLYKDYVGKVIGFGKENSIQVGPWIIETEIVDWNNHPIENDDDDKQEQQQQHQIVVVVDSENETKANELLKKRAIPSWDDFMKGQIEYYIEVPMIIMDDNDGECCGCRPLVLISEFIKATRPEAWKHSDLRIQSTLPLAGNDDIASSALSAMKKTKESFTLGKDWKLVKVSLYLDSILPTSSHSLPPTTETTLPNNTSQNIKCNDEFGSMGMDNENGSNGTVVNVAKNGETEKESSMITSTTLTTNTVQEETTTIIHDESSSKDEKKPNGTVRNSDAKKNGSEPSKEDRQRMENLWESLINPFVKK